MIGSNIIVGGWYTPDYAHYAEVLVSDIERLGLEHDFIAADVEAPEWNSITLHKATFVRHLMCRHPEKTLILLDVDCRITGTREDIEHLASFPGDVAMFAQSRFRSNGTPQFTVRSGTMVFKPTQKAAELAIKWHVACIAAPYHSHDQDALLASLGRVSGLSVSILPVPFCATEDDVVINPVISHASAAREIERTTGKRRRPRRWYRHLVNAVFWVRPPWSSGVA